MRELGFYFCLRFRRHFFRHTDFLGFEISKKIFFLNSDFRYHRKMYRLFPCIPIFRGFFMIKSTKSMCLCDYVKNRIGTCWNLCFGGKKGYKQKRAPDSCKTYCFDQMLEDSRPLFYEYYQPLWFVTKPVKLSLEFLVVQQWEK